MYLGADSHKIDIYHIGSVYQKKTSACCCFFNKAIVVDYITLVNRDRSHSKPQLKSEVVLNWT